MSFRYWAPYVSVAKRRAKAAKEIDQLRKKGKNIQPIEITGRKIASSFWGNAWCKHLESFSDYDNRLPRGRTYVRNGSVCHLEVRKGKIDAIVSGSSLYNVKVSISPLTPTHWQTIKKQCAGQISSILDLLRGSLSDGVMAIVTDRKNGMFPLDKEIKFDCDCPDWADMCKHIAAVLYGIGARLDQSPDLLFLLRGVDHEELVDTDFQLPQKSSSKHYLKGDLSDVFGIDFDDENDSVSMDRKKPVSKNTKIGKKNENRQTKKKTQKRTTIKKSFSISGIGVVRLRKKFAMNVSQFSTLTKVSPGTVKNWEEKSGKLNLKPANEKSLATVADLNKVDAWKLFNKNRTR